MTDLYSDENLVLTLRVIDDSKHEGAYLHRDGGRIWGYVKDAGRSEEIERGRLDHIQSDQLPGLVGYLIEKQMITGTQELSGRWSGLKLTASGVDSLRAFAKEPGRVAAYLAAARSSVWAMMTHIVFPIVAAVLAAVIIVALGVGS